MNEVVNLLAVAILLAIMDSAALRADGEEMLKYIGEFWDSLRERQTLHNIKPGKLVSFVLKPH